MMNVFKLRKRFIFAIALIMIGLFAMTDSTFANNYKHNSRNNFKSQNYYNKYKNYRSTYKSNRSFYGNSSNRYKYNYKPYYNSNRNNRSYSQSRRHYKNSYTAPYNSYGYVNKRAYKKYKAPFAGYINNYHQSKVYQKPKVYHQPKTVAHCYDYKVTTRGGRGGFRFQHSVENFHKIDNQTYVSQICGHNVVEFELSKLNPAVSISIDIAGKVFHYPAYSGHHKLINNWHRKYFSVKF